MEVVTPTNARKNLYSIIKSVVSNNEPIEIANSKDNHGNVVLISKEDWEAIQETLYLKNTHVLDQITSHEAEETEELGEVKWDII